MNSQERRESILERIKSSSKPIKGSMLAQRFNVSRQVIVQDIALLRAGGEDIIATPQGYMMPSPSGNNFIKRVIASKHGEDRMEEELMTIVNYGGTIVDVMVEHEVYGEFKAELMIRSPKDVKDFIMEMKRKEERPLSYLSGGIHLHTIEARDRKTLDDIENMLSSKGFLLNRE